MKKVVTFGTFDGVHDGHREMLKQAKALGNYLIVAVAPDEVVKQIKGVIPRNNTAHRIAVLKAERLADEVVAADSDLGSWKILNKFKPAIIALGYDQQELRSALESYINEKYPDIETDEGWQNNPRKPKIMVLQPHEPERFKSSLIKHD